MTRSSFCALLICASLPAMAATCESLASLALPQAKITKAELSGEVCRVAATLTPTSDSEIKIEVLLPVRNWNGKLQAVGNGGWSGSINDNGMMAAARAGYASASTDTGHSGGSASFALGHPEKLIDYA